MTALSMAALVAEAGRLSLPALQQRYGEAFLLYTGSMHQFRAPPREWQETFQTQGRRVGMVAPDDLFKIIAYPLPGCTTDPWFATVGRVEPNQVILPDESVSVFHALFRRGDKGEFLLQDAGSKNGTFVKEKAAPHRDSGRAIKVKPNDSVRFGSVVLTFLRPAEMHDLILVLASVAPRVERAAASSALDVGELFEDLGPGASGAHPLSGDLIAFLEAVQQIEDGLYAPAIRALSHVLAGDPGNRNAVIWLKVAEARVLAQKGNRDGAVARYREILELDPNHAEARKALGGSP
jgi:hypothetical protein